MELAKILKSKKGKLALGLVVVIVVGFFALKFMSATTDEPAESGKPRATHRTTQKPSTKTAKKDEPEKSPLFQAMQALKDPFQAEDPKAAELKEKLDLAKKEVEYLKAILEEKKLKQEIREIEHSLAQDRTDLAGGETAILAPPSIGEKGAASDGLVVKAILLTDDQRSALLVSGGKSSWVHQGERFDGWEIKEIREQSVVVLKKGRTFVFFYDRPEVGREGDS
jgi:hypothetical protein